MQNEGQNKNSKSKEQNNVMEKKSSVADHESAEEDLNTMCGIGSFTPQWLQRMANPKIYLLNYCILAICQGAHFTYLVGSISTLEKRYAYDSKTTGIIMIADELPPVLFGLLVGYYGGKGHRPRIIMLGMLTGVVSCFTMALPYFVYGAAEHLTSLSLMNQNSTNQELCDFEEKSKLCDKSPALVAVVFLFIGNFLKGFCVLTFYTIGASYLDDNVAKKNSPLYFGTAFALRLAGPTIGFLLSSFCLQLYENPFVDPGFDQSDPRWVGAWWLGFIIIGIFTLIFSLPLPLFPRELKQKKEDVNETKNPETTKNPEKKSTTALTPKEQMKEMKNVTLRLLKNPVYMFHILGSVFYFNGVYGYYVNLPRYMEAQFRQPPSKANLYSGPASVISMQIGTLLGGAVIRKFRPRARLLTGYMVFVDIITVIGLLSCLSFTCPILQMTGTALNHDMTLKLDNKCNAGCQCTTRAYTPVCGPDGKSTYFSPCFAGCTGFNTTQDGKLFTDCKCVHDDFGDTIEGEASSGFCQADCGYMVAYIAMLSVCKMISSTSRVGSMVVYLRSVAPEDKSVALGILEGSLSLLAFIPYPLIYGELVDISCLVWEKSCGQTGNCWVYDVDKFRYFLHVVTSILVFLSVLMNVFMCVYSGRLKNLYDDEDNEEEQKSCFKMKTGTEGGKQAELLKIKYTGDSLPAASSESRY